MVSVFDFQPCPQNRDEIYGGARFFSNCEKRRYGFPTESNG